MKISEAVFNLVGYSPVASDASLKERVDVISSRSPGNRLHVSQKKLVAISSREVERPEIAEAKAYHLVHALAFAGFNAGALGDARKLLLVPSTFPGCDDIPACNLFYDDRPGREGLLPSEWIKDTGTSFIYVGDSLAPGVAEFASVSMSHFAEESKFLRQEILLGSLVKKAGGFAYGINMDLATLTGGHVTRNPIVPETGWDEDGLKGALEDMRMASSACLDLIGQKTLDGFACYRNAVGHAMLVDDCSDLWDHAANLATERMREDVDFRDAVNRAWQRHANDRGKRPFATREIGEAIGVRELLDTYFSGVPVSDIIA